MAVARGMGPAAVLVWHHVPVYHRRPEEQVSVSLKTRNERGGCGVGLLPGRGAPASSSRPLVAGSWSGKWVSRSVPLPSLLGAVNAWFRGSEHSALWFEFVGACTTGVNCRIVAAKRSALKISRRLIRH